MMANDRALIRMINSYIDNGDIYDVIDYIDLQRKKISVKELDAALEHWNINPNQYRAKDEKVRALIDKLGQLASESVSELGKIGSNSVF